ncbi:MAG: hypothetical protein JF612_08085, partial [Planctomycetia bacterium]|nr:hypothetical protein [Planctomycetia bacterium]
MSCLSRYALLLLLLIAWPSPADAQSTAKQRPPWTTSRITGAPEPPRPYVAERIFPSLAFNQPVELVAVPGTNRLLVLELNGKIFTFNNQPLAAEVSRDQFADIKDRDRSFARLYGFAFH